MVKVAIVTRTKDREAFLRRALESVRSQKYNNYIHVIVNDGGNEDKVNTIVNSLTYEQRIKTKVFHREKPSNAPDTIFNESINRVNSDFFAIHDDDDSWHPSFLQHTVGYLESHKKQAAVVVATNRITETIDRNNRILQKKKTAWMPELEAISLYRQCKDNQLTPISTLFRRSTYESINGFDDTLPVVGDWEFGIRLLMEYDVGFINPGFALANYHHRINKDNSFSLHSHREYVTFVINKYLRRDLNSGGLGVGYIMNDLKYTEDIRHQMVKNILPKIITNRIKKHRT